VCIQCGADGHFVGHRPHVSATEKESLTISIGTKAPPSSKTKNKWTKNGTK
jgi:hypothetical protein